MVLGRLVPVDEMEVLEGVTDGEGDGEGVLLGPVTGMTTDEVAVSDGTSGLENRDRDGLVGVKKSLAKASCVNTRSAGVGVGVRARRTTSLCLSTLSPDNMKGKPNAKRQMTGMIKIMIRP